MLVRGRRREGVGACVVDRLIVRDSHEVGLFVVEQKSEDGRWNARDSISTLKGAQERAWDLLTREGGEVRVRQGGEIVALGATYERSES